MYVIYALVDPRDNTVRYVGLTSDVYERFLQHINCSSANFAKNAWIMELRAANKMVSMETLEEVDTREQALEREEYWIKHFEMMKEPVMNISRMSSPRKAKKNNLRIGRSIGSTFQEQEVIPSVIGNLATVQKINPVIEQPMEASPDTGGVPPDEKLQIVTIARMQLSVYGKVKRNEIPAQMGKNNRYYSVVKQVLDEEGIR